jgi:endonuclease/exonuclease/phosphatase family metal-dependent hydrolase
MPSRSTAVLVLLLAALLAGAGILLLRRPTSPPRAADPETTDFLFCFWNVENFFDDQRNPKLSGPDQEFDLWFAEHPDILKLKLQKLTEALLKLKEGQGPDILALVEVESRRAAELLRDALNQHLPESLHYQHVLMKEIQAGRHIAPAILTRLPVIGDRTQLLHKALRILEGHIRVQGQELVLLVSHWTSQLQKTGELGRDKYAKQIYGRYKAMYLSNPAVDLLVCGDFNDPPTAEPVVTYLHSVADVSALRNDAAGDPPLLNLFAGKDPRRYGTHYHRGHWLIYDQILISPGLLDNQGWSCDPESVTTVNSLYRPGDPHRAPWRFGSPHQTGPRGYSDHFPVTVRLRVHP